ncbi:MAG: PQQ-dependent sugar dehydrogenase [Sphingopyxis sp.]|uniref:PQQ-dependent sugar dehydrogenase n=1 Tax=Sphingopyxis sp. TaxID=1908224 RepID=UPI001A27AFF4|nr:PQQ-dependent sugar dehydrogenase [Sphingopyxis sp.]MBJ7501874.1 PQQ-dependent sugar dehydrogenase [Sphingopyxis sp.]
MRLRVFAALTPLLLTSCGGGGGGGGGGTPPTANGPPAFTSLQTVSVAENTTAAYQATASDPDGDALTFAIDGGADAARFSITAAGALRFREAPDYDLPGDADGDNVYAVQLRVSDAGASATQTVNITVTNSREGISVARVGSGFDQPTYLLGIPGSGDVYVLEKAGRVYRLTPSTGARTLLFTVGDLSTDGERGLLGMALLPNPANSDRFMIYCTNAAGDIELREYGSLSGSPRVLARLVIPHPGANNHNGGSMVFGPDGYLYVGVGDGGGAGDPGNNAQNPDSQLGKILRIWVVPDPYAGASVPSDRDFLRPAPGNPYIGGGGDPYVYALGLRNPFRTSFSGTSLIIADVGQGAREEIDLVTTTQPGLNFGWRFREGTQPFTGTSPAGLTDPVAEYGHGSGPRQGNSITGGYVYRGPVTSLQGQYVFADFVSGNIWSIPFASLVPGQTLASSRFGRRNEDFAPDAGALSQIVSFGEDSAGNLFIVGLGGDIFMVRPG